MVARFIQKYWRGKANYCHYDSHDKNSLLLLEPLLHDLRMSLHSPSIACPRCPVPTKKDDTKVRLFPFRALCCCLTFLFFVFPFAELVQRRWPTWFLASARLDILAGIFKMIFFSTMFRHGFRGFFSQSESKLQGRQPTRVSLSGTL